MLGAASSTAAEVFRWASISPIWRVINEITELNGAATGAGPDRMVDFLVGEGSTNVVLRGSRDGKMLRSTRQAIRRATGASDLNQRTARTV